MVMLVKWKGKTHPELMHIPEVRGERHKHQEVCGNPWNMVIVNGGCVVGSYDDIPYKYGTEGVEVWRRPMLGIPYSIRSDCEGNTLAWVGGTIRRYTASRDEDLVITTGLDVGKKHTPSWCMTLSAGISTNC